MERGGDVHDFPAPAVELPIIASHGAGDSLAVGFLDADALDGLPSPDAVPRGQLCARWCSSVVCGDGLITRADLNHLLDLARE